MLNNLIQNYYQEIMTTNFPKTALKMDHSVNSLFFKYNIQFATTTIIKKRRIHISQEQLLPWSTVETLSFIKFSKQFVTHQLSRNETTMLPKIASDLVYF